MRKLTFKKHLLTSSIAMVVASGMSVQAFAADESTVDEVVVTGIKASIQNAMNIKREAAGVVDAISAEDIGKMPDANLAESLQRITGVSIDRSGGEGSKVTVRGLAGDYNLVTLNGRQMPASTVGNNGASNSRSFDFANLASEGIAGVEVYKTGRADLDSGGIGALINIITPHPLKNPGLKASVGVKAVDDTSSEKSDITPEISGLFSDTFADDRIGVAVTGSYQQRKSGNRAVDSGWLNAAPDGADWGGAQIPESARPTDWQHKAFVVPTNIGYSYTETDRKRTNGQLTLQFKPVDQLEITADYLKVIQKVDGDRHYAGMWFDHWAGPLDIKWNSGNPAYPMSYSEVRGANEDLDVGDSITGRKSELGSAGLNIKWEVSDHFKVTVDTHNSNSRSGPNSPYGTENSFDAAAYHRYQAIVDYSREVPSLKVVSVDNAGNPDGQAVPNVPNYQLSGNTWKRAIQNSGVSEQQVKGEYTFDDSFLKSVTVGGGKIKNDNTSIWMGRQMENQGSWGGVQGANGIGDIPASYFPTDKWSSHFDANFGSGFYDTFVNIDAKKLIPLAGKLYGSSVKSASNPCPMSYCYVTNLADTNDGGSDQRAVEYTDSGFLQGKFGTEYNGMPVNILLGLRYEHTAVEAKSLLTAYQSNIQWNSGNEYSLVPQPGGFQFLKGYGGYHELLPSFDYDIGITDTIKARASFSQTIARPDYDQIKGGLVYGSSPRNVGGTASSGNPDLNPLKSTNYDVSVEWYYGDASYVSAGYFNKHVVDFIGSTTETVRNSGFHSVYNGPRWQTAAAAVADGSSPSIIQWFLDHADANVDVANKHVLATSDDPVIPFDVTKPINSQDATIHGFEVNVQHTFGESGFGLIVNGTKVSADVSFDDTKYATQFAILGLSDSANFIAFYDKNGIQARIAYNWRDKFLAGGGNNPTYVDAYGQVDASASYKLTDNLTLSVEGVNILNETTRRYGRDWHQLINYTETGARYNLGARYTF